MPLDPNDAKLTAYALGELDDSERAALEEQLAHSELARAAVESTRRTAALLSEQLAKEPLSTLSDAQRDAIEARLQPVPQTLRTSRWGQLSLAASMLAAAACLALAFLIPAIERARSEAKLAKAQNNLRQLALGGHRYGDLHPSLPGYASPYPDWTTTGELLPFVEVRPVFDSLNFNGAATANWNSSIGQVDRDAMRKRIEVFLCPSDALALRNHLSYRTHSSPGLFADSTPSQGGTSTTLMFGEKIMGLEVLSGRSAREPGERGETAFQFGGENDGEKSVPGGIESAPKKRPRTWRRSAVTPNTSRLMVGDQEELPLKGLQANVRIDGFRARVVLDCYFYNRHDRRLEGTFQLRLPGGASPYYFAFGETAYEVPNLPPEKPVFFNIMDTRRMGTAPGEIFAARRGTWNEPKEARMVQKEKAAHAYRETVRRRVDPALVEWSGAGVFSSRVFPLEPGKLHRIVIGYDVDLAKVGDDLVYRLDLPEVASDLVVDLNVAALPGVTAAVTPDAEPFTANGRAYYRFEQPEDRTIAVQLEDPGNLLVHGSDPESGDYFAAALRPDLPAGDQAPAASHAVFLVDTSLSSNPARYNVYLALLEKILESNRDSLKGLAVLFFNVDTFWWRDGYMPNTPENTAALVEYAKTLSLEGATDLARALGEATHPHWAGAGELPKPDLFLLSDGALTWGNDQAYALTEPLKAVGAVFAYVTDPTGTNTRVLAHLARESGGAVFPVLSDEAVAKAATAHRFRPWRLDGIELAGTGDLLLAGRPQSIYPGQDLLLVGRGTPEADGEITLALERGGERKSVRIKINHTTDSALAPRAYGQVAVGQLEDLADATRDVSVAYARHFRVTGQTCSLLMLESEADYQRFNIKPEEDAFVVKSQPASRIIDRVVEKFRAMLADPKAAFLNWLERLQQMPGMQFNSPTALRLALEQMPESSFHVNSPALACKLRTTADLSEAIRKQLAARDVNYDTVTSEAARRLAAAGPADALRALSSLIETNPGDTPLATDVAYSALQWGLPADAFHLFRRVSLRRPYEPQAYHSLAQTLAELGNADLAIAYYEVALAGQWDGRFGPFHRIVSLDYLHLLRQIAAGQMNTSVPDFAKARLESLAGAADLKQADLVVTIAWNTDGTDVDLHVFEPGGEQCYYQHRNTASGGELTPDVTQGHGPEMYVLRNAPAGTYAIKANYFSSDVNRASTRTSVSATIYQNWGTKHEKVTRKTVTLTKGKEMHEIATVKVEK